MDSKKGNTVFTGGGGGDTMSPPPWFLEHQKSLVRIGLMFKKMSSFKLSESFKTVTQGVRDIF